MATLIILFALMVLWFWVTQPVIVRSNSVEIPDVDKVRLQQHVETLTKSYGPRDAFHHKNLDRVADYIGKNFAATSAIVSNQTWNVEGNTFRNVRVMFGSGKQPRIVVGAHYDTWYRYAGADDNASGVAALLELARVLEGRQLSNDVELVAYSLEEPPFFKSESMGSAKHASLLKKESVQVLLMVSVEMVGYFQDARGSQKYPASILKLFYPSRANFISVVGDMKNGWTVRKVKQLMLGASALPVYSMNGPRAIPGIDFSDHVNYWENGYDAVMITDTAFYRNPNYHTAADVAETLDYERLSMVVKGLFRIAVGYR